MTAKILLDTHIAVWLDTGDDRLRGPTRALIDRHWHDGGTILLSAVTAWEIAQLVDDGCCFLDCPVDAWVERFAGRPGIELVNLSCKAATLAYRLHHLPHRDPADRLLIATAIENACSFVTYDSRIMAFANDHGGRYGFALADI